MISSSAINERRFHGDSPTSPSNRSHVVEPTNPKRTYKAIEEGTKSQGEEKMHLANRALDVILVNGELFYLQKSSIMANLDDIGGSWMSHEQAKDLLEKADLQSRTRLLQEQIFRQQQENLQERQETARHAQAAPHWVLRAADTETTFEKQELTMDNIFSHDHGHDHDYDDLANSPWNYNGQLHDISCETKSFDRRETVCETPLELYARLRGPSFDDVLHDDNHFSGWYFDHRVDTAACTTDDNDPKAWDIRDVVPVTTTYHSNGNYTSYILHVRLISSMSTMEFDVEARHSEFLVAHEEVIQVIQSIRTRMGEERMELLNTDEPLPPPKHWYGSNGETVTRRRLREWAALPLNTVRQLPKITCVPFGVEEFSKAGEINMLYELEKEKSAREKKEEELLLELERKRNQRGLKYLNEINKLWTEVSCEWIKFFLEHKKEEGTQ